jgi:hypothetical protein
MVLFRRRRSRRGVSPVISNLILLAAVLGAGMFLWWFALTRTSIATTDYADTVSEGIEKVEERFVIEHVQIINKTDGGPENYDVSVWIYNYGKIDVNITDIYLDHERHIIPNGLYIPIGDIQVYPFSNVDFKPEFVQVQSARDNVVVGS